MSLEQAFCLQVGKLFQMLLVFRIALLLFRDKRIGFGAMLIYFTLPLVLASSRNLTTDAYLNTNILASIYSWPQYKTDSKKVIFLYLFFLMMGVAFEIKGSLAWLMPVIFIGFYKLVNKNCRRSTVHLFLGFF